MTLKTVRIHIPEACMKPLTSLSLILVAFMLAALPGCSGSVDSGANSSPGSKITSKLIGSEIQVSTAGDDQQNPAGSLFVR